MPGGIHPPIEVVLTWPAPNEINPEKRSDALIYISCIGGPITILLLLVRLWVRIFHTGNPGWDDWVMLFAMIPTTVLTILFPIASAYAFDKHIWDYNPSKYPDIMVTSRKYVLAIECVFCVASGLIKVSILLFYRRLSARVVSSSFKWMTRITIGFIIAYTIALTIAPLVGCNPTSAFWDQVDIVKQLNGYKFHCFDEGADVFAASIISVVQDFVTAALPTLLYWNLQIPLRQKVALFGIFAVGYGVVGLGAFRAYFSWKIFYQTYDVTWYTWDLMLVTALELHIGAFCANAPVLKVFFKHFFHGTVVSLARTRNTTALDGSRSSGSSRIVDKMSSFLSSKTKSGYISEPHTSVSVDVHGGVKVQKEFQVTTASVNDLGDIQSSTTGGDATYGHYHQDIELESCGRVRILQAPQTSLKLREEIEAELGRIETLPESPKRIKLCKTPSISRSSSGERTISWPLPPSMEQSPPKPTQSRRDSQPSWQPWV